MRRLAALLLSLYATVSLAHKPSDSYLNLNVEGTRIQGQWDIALRDLDFALGLDADDNGAITWGELRSRQAELASYALAQLRIENAGSTCALTAREHLVDEHTDGAYAVLRFSADCASARGDLWLSYHLFFDVDPQHRGLLRVNNLGSTHTAIFSPEHSRQSLDMRASAPWRQLLDYGREGVWHIWIGYDHILFLLSLLLPAVLVREARSWRPVVGFRTALVEVVKIVTAFTLAHSITLGLAAFGVISLPSRWVESAIAASVVFAGLNNLYPVIHGRRWAVAFGFGLVHGLGFANVLADLGLPTGSLLLALLGFNLGVETGQVALVAAFLPLAYTARHSFLYRRVALGLGSVAIVCLASLWLVERSFDLKLGLTTGSGQASHLRSALTTGPTSPFPRPR
ncbi:MAG: HupE/UreJ family protein [Porticoccaceae bacterium]